VRGCRSPGRVESAGPRSQLDGLGHDEPAFLRTQAGQRVRLLLLGRGRVPSRRGADVSARCLAEPLGDGLSRGRRLHARAGLRDQVVGGATGQGAAGSASWPGGWTGGTDAIRNWIELGVIPPAPIRLKRGVRAWPAAEADAIVAAARHEGIIGTGTGTRLGETNFSLRAWEARTRQQQREGN
jgi:hypothetical protein